MFCVLLLAFSALLRWWFTLHVLDGVFVDGFNGEIHWDDSPDGSGGARCDVTSGHAPRDVLVSGAQLLGQSHRGYDYMYIKEARVALGRSSENLPDGENVEVQTKFVNEAVATNLVSRCFAR